MPEVIAPQDGFIEVPLPMLPAGKRSVTGLMRAVSGWVTSRPMRALAEASSWVWPDCDDASELIARIITFSQDWDFRGRSSSLERHLIEPMPTRVNGRTVAEELVISAATALGLVRSAPIPADPFTHLVVLSGQVNACVNRTRLAADLLRGGLAADSVVVLSAHRELAGKEPAQAREHGFGDLFDETDAVIAATRQAFSLAEATHAELSGPRHVGWDRALWGASSRYRWDEAEVVVAPSSDPSRRRANTKDQLRYWAELADLGHHDRVLLITTQIYAPFQQLVALRLLGLERGCGVYCCGVDATNSALRLPDFTGQDYLQEIRSALLAASDLMAAAQLAGG